MKALTSYIQTINESNESVISKILDKLQQKYDVATLIPFLYGIVLYYPNHSGWGINYQSQYAEHTGYGHTDKLKDNPEPAKAYVTNEFYVHVITLEKGNYYGIEKTDDPKIAQYFKNRVKGLQNYLWTNSIDNVKKYIQLIFERESDVINTINFEDFWFRAGNMNWAVKGLFTTPEEAKKHIPEIQKKINMEVSIVWSEKHLEQINNSIELVKSEIKRYKELIKQREDELQDLEDDKVEYQTLHDVSSTNFNESLIEN